MDRNLVNVIVLGLSFMFLFTSFQTGGFIQGKMMDSIKKDHPDYKASPFVSLCIIYFILAVANWLAPAFVKYFGPRLSMIVSGITYILFIANFLWPQAWLLYLVSAIVGFGAAIIWNAQGLYLTLCSNDNTITRNSGIFWTLLQFSLLFGNIFVYVYFSEKGTDIDATSRNTTYIVLAIIGSIGIGIFMFLRPPKSQHTENQPDQANITALQQIFDSINESFKLAFTKRMLLLGAVFWYTGLELSFFSGVYTTALGRMNSLDSTGIQKNVGLAGMLIGIGEITGGLIFGIFGTKTIKWGRDPIVLIGYLVHMVAFFMIFLNFKADSTLTDNPVKTTFITPSLTIALICSFLLGFADSCYNTQIYSILGSLYSENSSPAFAFFKFAQSLSCACAFFYADYFDLYVQLILLAIFASIGTITFVWVERNSRKESQQNANRSHQS